MGFQWFIDTRESSSKETVGYVIETDTKCCPVDKIQ